MYSQILIKLNSFVKKRFIEFSGILLVIASVFLLISILSYDQGDPSLTYTPETNLIKNLGGFYGSAIADFILQSIGLVSFFIIINLFNWGFTLMKEKKIDKCLESKDNNFCDDLNLYTTFLIEIMGNEEYAKLIDSDKCKIGTQCGATISRISGKYLQIMEFHLKKSKPKLVQERLLSSSIFLLLLIKFFLLL